MTVTMQVKPSVLVVLPSTHGVVTHGNPLTFDLLVPEVTLFLIPPIMVSSQDDFVPLQPVKVQLLDDLMVVLKGHVSCYDDDVATMHHVIPHFDYVIVHRLYVDKVPLSVNQNPRMTKVLICGKPVHIIFSFLKIRSRPEIPM
jgi:hypothetical protein